MTSSGSHPSPDELRAMAYVDGELPQPERAEFEQRMRTEPELARSVAEFQALARFSSDLLPPEPADLEWQKLEQEPLQRLGLPLGWTLCLVSAIGLIGASMIGLWLSGSSLGEKLLITAGVAGLTILFLIVLRARLRVLPYDPYRKVIR